MVKADAFGGEILRIAPETAKQYRGRFKRKFQSLGDTLPLVAESNFLPLFLTSELVERTVTCRRRLAEACKQTRLVWLKEARYPRFVSSPAISREAKIVLFEMEDDRHFAKIRLR